MLRRLHTLAVILFFGIPVLSNGQENGISVGQPKVYDNQSLTIMLDQLNTRLGQIQAIDQQPLMKALGLIQGSQEQDVSQSFSVSVSPTPKAGSDAGSDSSTSAGKKSSTDNSSSSALPELLAAPAYKPDYGENALDLLSDQVDLTYQIFNLRMLLERSVTDRLKGDAPRRQAVVSFNISLDPPKNASDAAAYVEITLSSAAGPLSLVASMPQEKTYNATSLSASSHAFGGSAVAKIISVNYNQRRRKQIFFLYRDSDTLAFERSPAPNAVTFGWLFRPVLGRRSVSPGMRQMFAVIALPTNDLPGDAAKEQNAYPSVQATARTYWLHYDKSTTTTDRSKYPGFWHWSARRLPQNKEEIKLDDIPTLPTESIEKDLGPTITDVRRFQTTSGNTVLQIAGTNFFSGTTVTIGDKTFAGPQDGLYLKSSQTMLLTANSDLLSSALSAVVNGRYGPAIPLYPSASPQGIVIAKSKLTPVGPSYSTLEIMVGDARPDHGLTSDSIKDYPDLILSLNGTRIPYRSDVGDTTDSVAPFPKRKYVIATVKVPNSLLHSRDNRAGIVFPLLGETWSAEDLIYDSDEVQVTKMEAGKTTTLLISRPGMEFDKEWRLILDKTYPLTDEPRAKPATGKKTQGKGKPPVPTVSFSRVLPCHDASIKDDTNYCSLVKIVADTKFLSEYQKFILVADDGYAQTIDLSTSTTQKETVPSGPPKITSIEPATVGLNEVVVVTVGGTGLDAVKQVLFEGKPLTFWAVPEKKPSAGAAAVEGTADNMVKTGKLEVLLNRDMTSKEGHQSILLQADAKNMSTAVITIAPGPAVATAPKPVTAKANSK